MSVRSAAEAVAAVEGGATVVDVKEPTLGPLGPATPESWAQVRAVVPARIPVSVALGELADRRDEPPPPASDFAGVSFRKLGLAGAGDDWQAGWRRVRARWGPGPAWVAVAYADWRTASAPDPDAVLDHALTIPECLGVLVDTWDKSAASPLDSSWADWVARAREGGRFVALAGRLDLMAIRRLAPLAPDLFAVRGAACPGGDRGGRVDASLVARLVEELSRHPTPGTPIATPPGRPSPSPPRTAHPSVPGANMADRAAESRLWVRSASGPEPEPDPPCPPACPVCGGPLFEIRQKLQCRRCRAICETCCEGGRG